MAAHFGIAETSSGAASVLNSLNAAANQQAAQIQRQNAAQAVQDHQDQQDHFRALQDGWQDVQQETRMPSGMIDRTQPTSPNADPNRPQTMIGRRMMSKPTDAESGKTFRLSEDLAKQANDAGLSNIRPNTDYPHTLLGNLNEAIAAHHKRTDPAKETYTYVPTGYKDKDGKDVAGLVGHDTHKFYPVDLSGAGSPPAPGGSTGGPFDTGVNPDRPTLKRADAPGDEPPQPSQPGAPAGIAAGGGMPGGPFTFKPTSADRPDVSQMIPGMKGPNGGMLIYDKNSQTTKEVNYPQGSTQSLNAQQTEADKDRHVRQSELQDTRDQRKTDSDQRRADTQAKVEESFARQHEASGLKKDNMQAMAQGYQDAMDTKPGATYFPPRLVNGIVQPGPATIMPQDNDARNARVAELGVTSRGFKKTAATHEAEQKRIEKQRGWGEFAPTTGSPAQPAQATQPVAATAATPAKTAAPAIAEGTIVRNPKTGERQKLTNGKWAAIAAGK